MVAGEGRRSMRGVRGLTAGGKKAGETGKGAGEAGKGAGEAGRGVGGRGGSGVGFLAGNHEPEWSP